MSLLDYNKLWRKFKRFNIPWHINPLNSTFQTSEFNKSEKIYGFYHIFAFNDWEDIVKDQMKDFHEFGLFEITDKIFISIISDNDEKVQIIKNLLPQKISQIISITDNKEVFEFPALDYLKKLSQKENFYAYYFHTKGTSISSATFSSYGLHLPSNLKLLKKNCNYWRKCMEYWCFNQWKLALSTLKQGYCAYGCLLLDGGDTFRHYKGNFWWTTSDHLKKCQSFTDLDRQDRFKAENWLLLGNNVNCYCAFYTVGSQYDIPLYPGIYIKKVNSSMVKVSYWLKYQIYCLKDIKLAFQGKKPL